MVVKVPQVLQVQKGPQDPLDQLALLDLLANLLLILPQQMLPPQLTHQQHTLLRMPQSKQMLQPRLLKLKPQLKLQKLKHQLRLQLRHQLKLQKLRLQPKLQQLKHQQLPPQRTAAAALMLQ